jgi:ABC-type bacteriocin/lantibiotic exporter with double-glycine peptidase domain
VTRIVAAHRPETIRSMDRVIVLDEKDGRRRLQVMDGRKAASAGVGEPPAGAD